jgi:hypothetical protein
MGAAQTGQSSAAPKLTLHLVRRALSFTSRDDLLDAPQTSPNGQHSSGNPYEYHLACHESHSTIDAIGALRRKNSIVPAQVRRVGLGVSDQGGRLVPRRRKKSMMGEGTMDRPLCSGLWRWRESTHAYGIIHQ